MGRATYGLLLLLGGCWVTNGEISVKFGPTAGTGTGTGTGAGTGTGTGTGAGTGTGTSTGTGTGTGITTSTLLPCADVSVGSAVGQAFSGTTASQGNDHTDACGVAATGNDVVHQWTAPNSACFSFDTRGSGYNTLLSLYEGSCGGTAVACNDNRNDADITSEFGFEVTGGEVYLLVVDGPDGGDNGTYELNIQPSARLTADLDLGSGTGNLTNSTAGLDDTLDPTDACPYSSGSDILMTWTAPSAGTWNFDLDPTVTTFDSVLSIHRQCVEDAMICDDFYNSLYPNGGEHIALTLQANEQIFIRVGGFQSTSGTFQLQIY